MNQDITIDFRDLVAFLWRGLLPTLVVAGSLAAFAYFTGRNQDLVYSTRATVLAAQPTADLRAFGVSLVAAPPLDALAYRIAAVSDPVIADALTVLGVEDPSLSTISNFRNRFQIRTEETRTSSLVHIDARAGTSDVARDTANAVAAALVEWDRDRARQNLDRVVSTLEQQIAALDEQIRSLQTQPNVTQEQIDSRLLLRADQQQSLYNARALSTAVIGNLEIIQPAPATAGRLPSSPTIRAIVAFLLGTIFVYGLMLVRRALDNRLRTVDALASATSLPVLGEFSRQRRKGRRLPPEGASFLRTNVLFEIGDERTKVVLVTSARPGDGKSSVAISLAESFARNGKDTLLVDADLRSPVVIDEFDIVPSVTSLSTYLENPHKELRPARVPISASQVLDVIPSRPKATNAATDLLSQGIRDRLEEWRQHYEVIVIDTPPVLAVADALVIAPHCTGVLFVTNMEKADRGSVTSAIQMLKRSGVRILGIAATRVTDNDKSEAYGYGYGYNYGQ